MKKKGIFHWISLILYAIGVLVGVAVSGATLWGDIEASVFDSSIIGDSKIRLNCPVIITKDEIGKISATLKNPEDREKSFFVRAHISDGYVSLIREVNQQISVPPGAKTHLEWEVFPEDRAYNRIILFRALVSPSYPIPSQGNSCGVLVMDIPFLTGTQFYVLLLVLGLVCIFEGILIWNKINRPMKDDMRSLTNGMYALAIFVYATVLASFWGFWILGVILFAASLLLIGIIFGRYYGASL